MLDNFQFRTKKGKMNIKTFLEHWKQGINGVTTFQQVKMQISSTWIIIIGLLCGITMCIIGFKTLWWLLIILVGGLFNTLIQLLGLVQKKNQLMMFENLQKEAFKYDEQESAND